MHRSHKLYLEDILTSINRIQNYILHPLPLTFWWKWGHLIYLIAFKDKELSER